MDRYDQIVLECHNNLEYLYLPHRVSDYNFDALKTEWQNRYSHHLFGGGYNNINGTSAERTHSTGTYLFSDVEFIWDLRSIMDP